MKKTYEKPMLGRKQVLNKITAATPLSLNEGEVDLPPPPPTP
jgi:hypothetical protein